MKLGVEPLIGLAIIYIGIIMSITPQFIFKKLLLKYDIKNYSDSTSDCYNSRNQSTLLDEVTKESDLWMLYINLFGLLTMLLTTISVSVWSDFVGRRSALLVSFFGFLLQSLLFSCTIAFNLSMKLLLVAVFLSSLGGGLASILAVSFSYIADTTSVESRTFRIVIGDLFVGLGTILSSFSSGYWIQAQGFTIPSFFSIFLNIISILYILFVLKEPHTGERSLNRLTFFSSLSFFFTIKPFKRIFRAVQSEENSFKQVLPFLLIIMLHSMYLSINVSISVIYEKSLPFCWSPGLIGIISSLNAMSYIVSLTAVKFLNKQLKDSGLLYISALASIICALFFAFGNSTKMLIIGAAISVFGGSILSVIRSIITKTVSENDQGSYLALVGIMESCGYLVGSVMYGSVYAHTIQWFSGFVYIIGVFIEVLIMITLCTVFNFGNLKYNKVKYEEIGDEDGSC